MPTLRRRLELVGHLARSVFGKFSDGFYFQTPVAFSARALGNAATVSGGKAGRLAHVMPFVLLVGFAPILAGCTTNKCGPSPKLLATWPGHSMEIYDCGGGFPPLASTATPAGTAAGVAPPEIVLSVGQQLQIAEQGDWGGHQISEPISDAPQVLQVTTGVSGKAVGVFTAIGIGFADVGAHIDLCGAGVCYLTEVRVTG